jgi:phosphate:Na+ symporter
MTQGLSQVEIGIAVAAAVILFLFGIEHFSQEIQRATGARFRRFLAKSTANRFAGFTIGAVVTAVIQSSTATSVIAVGLVNAGVISFRQSLGIIFGANVGTTVTAQLVALKVTDFAPALILFGFVAGLLPFRWRVFGRSIFYFGLVFFSLELVSAAVEPLKADPTLLNLLASLDGVVIGVAVGAAFTALVQSSSVTTGVAIVLLDQGALTLDSALPLIIGANIGTTITSMIASARMDRSAKRTAVAHALVNVLGALMFMPLVGTLAGGLKAAGLEGASALATAHLVFNVGTSAVFLAAITPFEKLILRIVRDDAVDDRPIPALSPAAFGESAVAARESVRAWAAEVVRTELACYTSAVLAIETRDSAIDNRGRRLATMVAYALEEASELVRRLADGKLDEERSESVLRLVVTIDHLRQLSDSLVDLLAISERLERQHARFSVDSLLEVQAVYPLFAKLLETLGELIEAPSDNDARAALRKREAAAEAALRAAYRSFLSLVRQLEERGELADFLSIHQRLRGKVHAFADYVASGVAVPE